MAVTNKLRFDLALLEHPYPAVADAHLEVWGRLAIAVLVEGPKPPFDYQMQVPLFETQWDLAELAEWFALHKDALCDLTLPSGDSYPAVLPGESLAQALRRLTNREFAEHEQGEQDRWYEALYQYRTQHSLRFAQRGSRLPDIIIGCNYGAGEISLTLYSSMAYSRYWTPSSGGRISLMAGLPGKRGACAM